MGQPPFELLPQPVAEERCDVYFARTKTVLEREGINPIVTMEIFPGRSGLLCGILEAEAFLRSILPPGSQVWALAEGESIEENEVVLRIIAPYNSFGLYETVLLGFLAQPSGWATAARECVQAARGIPVISFGARHVHPKVSDVMEYAAIVGGCAGCATPGGAKLASIAASGTMPHALILIMGDTVKATLAFDQHMPPEVPRLALVDTFKDEAEESLNVARALGERLYGVRLDTPPERGRVTAELVKEVRARLDQAGFPHVRIFVSGGLDPQRITYMLNNAAPVDGFGVGSYISGARPIDFTADIKEVEGRPLAKRGRIPGQIPNPRLKRIL